MDYQSEHDCSMDCGLYCSQTYNCHTNPRTLLQNRSNRRRLRVCHLFDTRIRCTSRLGTRLGSSWCMAPDADHLCTTTRGKSMYRTNLDKVRQPSAWTRCTGLMHGQL